ncbi:MAG TPA: LacI family DNA-binding transcriptional regulator [Acidimicrobiales bacterium]|nr:LacI family DNA-binding transcriptional regulator [Acidimicrobiales bacterium]
MSGKEEWRGPMAQSKVTVRDVARAAGLSVASVSRALSGSRPVRPEIARRVAEAAGLLGYRPDPVARALSLGSTSSIGLIVPDIMTPFFPSLAEAVERTLRSAGLSMLLMNAENDADWEQNCIHELISRRVDGLLISATHRTRSRKAIEEASKVIPVVQIDRFATASVDRVVTDATKTIQLCVDHMAAQGCTTFAFVGAKSSASPARARHLAFQRVSRVIDPEAPTRVLTSDFSMDWGYDAAKLIANRWPEVDAVVCANDLIALGVVQGSIDLGRDIPKELAVTGCDDTFFSGVSRPTVTSIAQPVWEIARTGIDLLDRYTRERHAVSIELDPELHIRGSTVRLGVTELPQASPGLPAPRPSAEASRA